MVSSKWLSKESNWKYLYLDNLSRFRSQENIRPSVPVGILHLDSLRNGLVSRWIELEPALLESKIENATLFRTIFCPICLEVSLKTKTRFFNGVGSAHCCCDWSLFPYFTNSDRVSWQSPERCRLIGASPQQFWRVSFKVNSSQRFLTLSVGLRIYR